MYYAVVSLLERSPAGKDDMTKKSLFRKWNNIGEAVGAIYKVNEK